jgi:predicted dehydrogenase
MSDRPNAPVTPEPSRREFLKSSSALVAGGALASSLLVAQNAYAGGGNEEIRIVVIGAGDRGTGAAVHAMNTAGPVKVVALADAFQDRASRSLQTLKKEHGNKVDVRPDRVFAGLDAYRKALEVPCDMVILAGPPGFRPIHFDAAVKAGKHVFMEKPVATDPAGVRQVLASAEEAKKKNLAVAVGLQRRHEKRYMETIKRLQDGAIGQIVAARAYWNGAGVWTRPRRPNQSEMEYQVLNWYYFNWLCGDHIVEQHIHNLDVINWLKGGYPVRANGMGGRQVRTGPDHGEIFDHHFVEFTYADGTDLSSQCRHIPGCFDRVNEYCQGTTGSADIGHGVFYDLKGKKTWSYGQGGGNGHQQEHHDLFAQLRKGDIPNEGEYGALSTMTAIMGRMCTYSGRELGWEECLNSKIDLGVKDFLSFSDEPPVKPDKDGRYRIPTPGITQVV